ncbi:immunity protein YezG family protein [Nocardia asteroides]|uniref:immunity protein YezG family protein n=1 Tax=Nocardia asteroides TaxID=1824 RepID=UPI001E2974D8|nr:immunity protein YezG family protein [Nocardia asteroides]UGT58283.1 antitoxin YezG family protein [Nocardia asteroides]
MTQNEFPATLTEDDIEYLHEDYSEYLIEDAPDGWVKIRYHAYCTIDHQACRAVAIFEDGSEQSFLTSPELLEAFHELRCSMFQPGIGAWFSSTYEFDEGDTREFSFEYGSQLPVEMDLTAADYARDFDYFPRDLEHIPEWLRLELESADRETGWYISPDGNGGRRAPKAIDFTIRIFDEESDRDPAGLQVYSSSEFKIPAATTPPSQNRLDVSPWVSDPSQHDAALNRIGRHLQLGAPAEWNRLTYRYIEAGLCRHGTLICESPDGVVANIVRPLRFEEKFAARRAGLSEFADWSEPELQEMFSQLREEMHNSERGTWYSAEFILDRSGRYSVDYDYNSLPSFIPKVSARMYAYDLEKFPRDSSNIPTWLSDAVRKADTAPDSLI